MQPPQTPDAKLDANLRARLAGGAEGLHSVVVSFRCYLTAEEAAARGLDGEGRNLTGNLAPEALRELARNDEVIQIALVPESFPSAG